MKDINIKTITREELAELVSTVAAEYATDNYGRVRYLYGCWVGEDGSVHQWKEDQWDEHFMVGTLVEEIYRELGIESADDPDGQAIYDSEDFSHQWFTEAVSELYEQLMEYKAEAFTPTEVLEISKDDVHEINVNIQYPSREISMTGYYVTKTADPIIYVESRKTDYASINTIDGESPHAVAFIKEDDFLIEASEADAEYKYTNAVGNVCFLRKF